MYSGTVYSISCKACGEEYIGETGRPLHVRIKEHLEGKSKIRPSTPLGTHRAQKHKFNDFEVAVTILAQETKTSTRKTLEAFWIGANNPKMNRKDECVNITRDFSHFLPLAF